MGQAFLCQPEGYRLARLVELWTLKESYVKAVGLGWRIPPDSFTVSGERVERTVGLPVSALSARPRLWGRRLCPRGQLSQPYSSGRIEGTTRFRPVEFAGSATPVPFGVDSGALTSTVDADGIDKPRK